MKINKILLSVIIMLMISSCNKPEKVDIIIKNAKVYTVNPDFTIEECMAVKDGKILEIGKEEKVLKRFKSNKVIDAEGRVIYPGFIDAHCHFYHYGLGLLKRADLIGTQSFDEIIEIIKKHHNKYPSYWIEGRGWDQNDWQVKEFPTREKLDELFPDNPVILTRIDGHAVLVNKKALELTGIDKNTTVDGGRIILKNGEPTGVLIDNAIELVSDSIPEPDNNMKALALLTAEKNCFEVGLTGIHDACLDKDIVELIDSLQKNGEMKMKVYAMLSQNEENISRFVKNGTYKTNRLNVRSIKLFADGALGSRGARLIKPYSDDPGNSGMIITSPDTIRYVCKIALESGYQVNTHAIGDSANRLILKIYSEFIKGKNDKRWRIEHSQVIAPEDFELFGKYSVIPSVQPTHATSDMYWAEDRVGAERIKGAYAYKQLLNENGWIPLGTDFPIENISPFYTFYAAVARKDLKGWPDKGFQKENVLSREETLRGMTIWAAKAAFETDEKGSLEPGKTADFIILDKDIMEIPEEEIPEVKVWKTFINGEEVFSR